MSTRAEDELTRLALSADPDTQVGDDAVSIWAVVDTEPFAGSRRLLPEWYMPAPAHGRGVLRGWRRRVVLMLVVTFVVINAYGLCSTYGVVRFG